MVSRNTSSTSGLPPGFRFHPTDEELIMHYLRNQATSKPCPVSIIPPIDIYKFDPWELPDKADFGEKEWYFFSPRDRKYPNGVRPNRAAVSGYWKATGTDKAIHSGSKHVGIKKALVFYKGKPPKGVKTDWIMHEYRLTQSTSQPYKQKGSMRLDDWVLCRIYKKKNLGRITCDDHEQRVLEDESSLANQIVATTTDYHHHHQAASESQPFKFPRACSLTHLWEFGAYMNMNNENSGFNNNNNQDINYGSFSYLGQVMQQQPRMDHDIKFQVNPQPMFELQ